MMFHFGRFVLGSSSQKRHPPLEAFRLGPISIPSGSGPPSANGKESEETPPAETQELL